MASNFFRSGFNFDNGSRTKEGLGSGSIFDGFWIINMKVEFNYNRDGTKFSDVGKKAKSNFVSRRANHKSTEDEP